MVKKIGFKYFKIFTEQRCCIVLLGKEISKIYFITVLTIEALKFYFRTRMKS